MLNLDEVLTFQEVAACGNFTMAAEKLHVTQSTISHQIKRLEDRVGHKLLNRTTRSVKLTLAGERFLPHAKQLITMSQSAESSLSIDKISGEVHIGVPEEFAYRHLPELLNRFRLHYPNVRLVVEIDMSINLSDHVDSGLLDFALLKEAPASSIAIHREPMVWMGHKDALDFTTLSFAFFPGECAFRRVAIAALERHNCPYSVILTSASLEALRIAAASGTVITVITQSDCPKELILDPESHCLPQLPMMGYHIKTAPQPSQPAAITLEIVKSLLITPR